MTLSFLRNGQEKFYKTARIFFHEIGLIAPQSKRQKTKTPQFKTTTTCAVNSQKLSFVAKIPRGCDVYSSLTLLLFPHLPWSFQLSHALTIL